MRRILISGLLIFICSAFACSVHAVKTAPMPESEIYTYDGEYDPASFLDWDELATAVCPKGHLHFLMVNPNHNEELKAVELVTVKWKGEYVVVTYKYFKDGVRYVFSIDRAMRHYMQIEPIEPVENLRMK